MKGICKAQRIKERQLHCNGERLSVSGERKPRRTPRRPLKPVRYRVDPEDEQILILRNGKRLRQIRGLDLFLSKNGEVYSLTRFGLRRLRVNYTRKRLYGKKSRNGVYNGPGYPYIIFRGRTYRVHILMATIWIRPRKDGEEVDHKDGNIDNFRLDNLEIVTKEENLRRRKILCALRKASRQLKDPSLNPKNMSPEQLEKIFKEYTVVNPETLE